jgi:hypothetical protein
MLRPGMEAFKGNKIFQCQMGIDVPQSLLLSTDGITAFFCSPQDRNAMRSVGHDTKWLRAEYL